MEKYIGWFFLGNQSEFFVLKLLVISFSIMKFHLTLSVHRTKYDRKSRDAACGKVCCLFCKPNETSKNCQLFPDMGSHLLFPLFPWQQGYVWGQIIGLVGLY